LKLSYFVEHHFEERFNRKQIENFESQFERKHKIDAYEICGYSFHKSLIYPTPRTKKFLKFTYFVGDEFDRRFSSQKVDEIELQIEDYIMDLKIKCTQEAKVQKDFIVIGVKKFSGEDRNRMKRWLKKSKFTTCVALEKLSFY
jgi:hypothetical protein